MSTAPIPGVMLGTGNTTAGKTDLAPALMELNLMQGPING